MRARQRLAWDRIAASVGELHGAPSTEYYRRCEIALHRARASGTSPASGCSSSTSGTRRSTPASWTGCASRERRRYGLDLSRVVAFRARRNTRDAGQPARCCAPTSASCRSPPAPSTSSTPWAPSSTSTSTSTAIGEVQRVLRPGRPGDRRRAAQVEPLPAAADGLAARPLRQVRLRAREVVQRPASCGGTIESGGPGGARAHRHPHHPGRPAHGRPLPLHPRHPALPADRRSLLWPFELLETRCRWPGRFGYLMAIVAEKPTRATAATRAGTPRGRGGQ